MLILLDELESLLQNSLRVPGSGRLLVHEAAIREIVHDLRKEAADQLSASQRLTAERDRILTDARTQARRIMDDAHLQTGTRLDDQAVVQAARQRARDIQVEAEQHAEHLRAEADRYVIAQLEALEARLQRLLREVQGGQQLLQGELESRGQGTRS